MIIVLPGSLLADDTAAMLHNNGGVLLNGNPAQFSSAIVQDDLVQTQKGSIATIDAFGSTVTIEPETMVQFEGNELFLDHGSLQVNTSTGLRVRVGCVRVIPVVAEWTQYDVTDIDGKVTVVAHKKDVYIEARDQKAKHDRDAEHSDRSIVHEAEQKTREEKCGAGIYAPTQADKPLLDRFPFRALGVGAIGVLTCWALCIEHPPLSPATPDWKQ